MKIKYVREIEDGVEDVILEKELNNKSLSEEDLADLVKFDDLEIISLQMNFADGVKCKDTHDLSRMKPDMVKEMKITVK